MLQQAVSLNPNDVNALLYLGIIEDKIGNRQDALPRYLKALEIARKKYDENHPDVAASYNNIGSVYQSLGVYEKALEYQQRALKINLQVLGENHPNLAASYNNIGFVYKSLVDYEKAVNYFKMAVEILCSSFKQSHPNILGALTNLINVAEKLQPSQLKILKPTYALCVETLGVEHKLTKKLARFIGS